MTHQGMVREINEDAIGWSEEHGVAFVADGVGGHVGGQLASTLAKRVMLDKASQHDMETTLADAHTAIAAEGTRNPELLGMGTTVVLLEQHAGEANIWWVGDSRAYHYRNRELSQITVDHSYVEILREKFRLTDEQIKHHPQRHVVTQTLGLDEPKPESTPVDLRRGDQVLLCSDGLSDDIDLAQLQQILREHAGDSKAACDALVKAALDAGGRDNISVVIVDIIGDTGAEPQPSSTSSVWLWFAVAAVLALAYFTLT